MKQFLRYILTLVAILMVTSNVWAEAKYIDAQYGTYSSTFNETNLKKITNGTAENNVKFSISEVKYYDSWGVQRLDYGEQSKNTTKTSTFSWDIVTQNDNNPFSVKVTSISCDVRGYQAKLNSNLKTANAYFAGNTAIDCKTNQIGNNGAKTVSTSSTSGNSTTLYMVTGGNSTTYTLQNIKYNYVVYQRVPLFQYKAIAIASPSGGGNVYASFIVNSFSSATATTISYSKDVLSTSTGMTKTAYFKAEAKAGYNFVGWATTPDATTYLSTNLTYSQDLTSYSNDDTKPTTLTLYAIFKAKNDPLISGSNISNIKVGATPTADYTFTHTATAKPSADTNADFYFTIAHTPDATSKDGSPNANLVISYDPATNKITALNSGSATITFTHKETDNYYPKTASYTVSVIKHTPEFTWNLPVYYNREVADFFSTTGSNALTYSSSDEDVATLSTGSNAQKLNLTTYNKEASTTLTITQAENYYWYGKTETKVVTPIDPNNHVPFVVTENNDNEVFVKRSYYGYQWNNGLQVGDGNGGFNRDNAKFILIEFSGIPDKLIFDYEPREVHITNTTTHPDNVFWFVQESTTNEGDFDRDGKNPFWDNKEYIWSTTSKNAGKTDSIQLSPNTKFIRLGYWGNFGTAFKNITVTEREEFHAVDNSDSEVEHLYFDANQVFTDKTLSFNLKYANAGYKVKVESNDSRFTVNPTSLSTIGGCKYGKENISVTYRSTTHYETTGNNSYIVISDELAELNGHRDTVYLHASSYKPTQQLEWREDFKAVDKPTVRVKDGEITNAATASSGLPVTYTSSDTTVIAVRNEGTVLLPKAAGEATITALQAGNETWQLVGPITKNFIVTDKIIQYIVWSDDLTDLVVGGDNVNLTAKVYLQNEETKQWEEHPELTENLVYTIDNTSVVSVAGNVLSIRSIGQTTATVTAPGNTDYAVATLTKPVRVRSAAAGCEDVLLLNHRDEVRFFAYNLDQIVQGEFAIDHTKGVPGTLSFQHSGASWDLGIQYYAGKIRAEYNTTDDSNWVLAKEVTPTEDQTNLEFDIPLPRNASKIRFVRPAGGQGYHYVSNIQVHPAQYIEAVETIDLGEIHVGSIEDTTFVVNYANIKDDVYLTTSSGTVTTNPTSFGEQCGEFGTKTITVQWIPSEVNANAHETVTLTDGVSGTTCVVNLIANVTPGTQNLYWQDRPKVISNCGDIEFPEQTTAHIDIIWEVISGDDVADFNGNGELELYKQGTITVKGSNTGNANYHPFEITYTFTINYDPIFLGIVDTDWNKIDNWNICRLPNENDIVTIKALVELVTHEKVKGMKFAENGKMHIAHNAGMTIGSHGLELTTNGLITIDNTPAGAGFLRVDPTTDNKPAKVTVKYTTRTYDNGSPRNEVWQYLGMPGANGQISSLEGVSMYHWKETSGWIQKSAADLQNIPAWDGYAFTQSKEKDATFKISVEPILDNKQIDFTCTPKGMKGDNLFVNSYLAPIDVTKIDEKDIVDPNNNLVRTFFIFNSGSWNDWNAGAGDITAASGYNQSSPGHYYSIPFYSAELIDDGTTQVVIPSMQGVYVYSAGESSIKLDYKKHVLGANAKNMHSPMRAPQQLMGDESFRRVRIQASSENSGADRMYIVQEKNTTPGYDNGYDGDNIIASGQVNIYTHEPFGQMEVSCSNHIDSMLIGFTAGTDTTYTLTFGAVIGEDMYLVDQLTDSLMHLSDGKQYTFYAQPNSVNDTRFRLLIIPNPEDDSSNNNGETSDVDNISSSVNLWIHDNIVYVLDAPHNSSLSIYSVSGMCIQAPHTIHHLPCTIDVSHLPTGVYVLRLNDKAFKIVCD